MAKLGLSQEDNIRTLINEIHPINRLKEKTNMIICSIIDAGIKTFNKI